MKNKPFLQNNGYLPLAPVATLKSNQYTSHYVAYYAIVTRHWVPPLQYAVSPPNDIIKHLVFLYFQPPWTSLVPTASSAAMAPTVSGLAPPRFG